MRHKVSLIATIMMALIIPQTVKAYDFSAIAPTGQTLYYNIVSGQAQVTSQNGYPDYYSTFPSGALVIPGNVTNNGTTYSVVSIDGSAFYYCSNLTSVTIPNTVTTIGSFAFSHCSGLTAVTIPNSVISIGMGAFRNCSSLTSITIPNGVASVAEYVFEHCSSLTAIIIPSSVTSIGSQAFIGCNSLTSISIPNGVTSIGSTAFCDCSNLESISLPDSLTMIDAATFRGCSSLTSITIPSGVTSIGWQAFKNCINLDTVLMMPFEAPSLGSDAFYNNASGRVFILNGCSFDNYYNNSSWTSFRNYLREAIININLNLSVNDYMFGTVSIIPGPGNRNIRCDSSVVIQATNYYGYFDHWSTGSTANPDTMYLAGDSTVTAYFTGLTVLSSDSERGTASHIKIGDHLDRIIATPNHGYHFDHWSNGSTVNPDTIHIVGDSTVIAFFERNTYHLSAEANDASLGSLSMPLGDSALYQDTLMVVASPIEYYHVGGWYGMDIVGVSANKDTVWVRMTNNCIVTCNFVINYYTVNVSSNDIVRGMVESNGTQFAYGSPCTITATAYTGYTFYGWNNGVTANPYTFAVVDDVELTALFIAENEEVYMVTVESADPTMGTVSGGGQALSGDTVTIRAISNPGYHFLRWNDNNTDSVRTVTVPANATYTAYFEANVDINDVEIINAKIYIQGEQIVVEGADSNPVTLYDINGRMLATKRDEYTASRFEAPSSGAYIIKIGNHPARKVVVVW